MCRLMKMNVKCSLVGNSKKRTFEIKERVWKWVQAWCRNMFSAGDKEILIKAALKAIPTYVTSLFKIPISLCDEVWSLFLQFMLENRDGHQKIA
ncbi:hypothetical protein TorRG33x02_240830 [Trema orientale]|uniref:Uncharacterized protein n=1 Tax=Trema orientale TaxID=63057 RepID=A0A2P5DUZ6_TREOI|nr:hypothetical protein TorRG33x02_240830 [Trema orientale]